MEISVLILKYSLVVTLRLLLAKKKCISLEQDNDIVHFREESNTRKPLGNKS